MVLMLVLVLMLEGVELLLYAIVKDGVSGISDGNARDDAVTERGVVAREAGEKYGRESDEGVNTSQHLPSTQPAFVSKLRISACVGS